MKKYKIRCPYCGSTYEQWEWLLKLRLIFVEKFNYLCPVCHKKSTWLYIFHLRHDSTNKEEQLFNKSKLWDDRL